MAERKRRPIPRHVRLELAQATLAYRSALAFSQEAQELLALATGYYRERRPPMLIADIILRFVETLRADPTVRSLWSEEGLEDMARMQIRWQAVAPELSPAQAAKRFGGEIYLERMRPEDRGRIIRVGDKFYPDVNESPPEERRRILDHFAWQIAYQHGEHSRDRETVDDARARLTGALKRLAGERFPPKLTRREIGDVLGLAEYAVKDLLARAEWGMGDAKKIFAGLLTDPQKPPFPG
jgi:hypothetical protein